MAIRKNLSKHLSGLPNVVSLLFNSDSYCLSQRHSGLSPISYIFVKTVVCPLFPFVKTVVCPLFPIYFFPMQHFPLKMLHLVFERAH